MVKKFKIHSYIVHIMSWLKFDLTHLSTKSICPPVEQVETLEELIRDPRTDFRHVFLLHKSLIMPDMDVDFFQVFNNFGAEDSGSTN